LTVSETTYKGKKAWRVSLGIRGKNLLSFRVRPAGSGFGVTWRNGRRESYVCYLSAAEWRTARKGSARSFAALITDRIEQRKARGESDPLRIDGLLRRVQAFQ
jgi:hypothetical protein